MRMKITAAAVAVLALLCLAMPSQAQNLTTISADNIQDVSGRNLAAGQLCFQATDEQNRIMSFRAGGGGQVITTPFCTPVVNGAVTNFSVPNPDETAPANIRYRVTVTPRPARPGAANNLLTYTGVYLCDIVGACDSPFTFDLDNYIPRETPVPVPTIGVPGATGAAGAAGATGPAGPGIAAWSGATTYAAGAVVSYMSALYSSIAGGNLNHLPTDTMYWTPVASGSDLPFGGPNPFWRDITHPDYGGCLYQYATTNNVLGTITAGTNTLTLDASLPGLEDGCGLYINGAGAVVTLAAPTGLTVAQKGPCQILVNVADTEGTCGSTTYEYAAASITVNGGISAASTTAVITTAAPPNTGLNNLGIDWLPTTTYAANDAIRFRGQFYKALVGGENGNIPFKNPTKWGAFLNSDNYTWVSGNLVADARGYVIWKKIGAGAWFCLTDTYIQDDTDDNEFHFEDHGQPSNCRLNIPATPPVAAGSDPLLTTLVSGEGTVNYVLANNAITSVAGLFVWPDNALAMDAALTQMKADQIATYNSAGTPCLLIPAGGNFFLSRLDFSHSLGAANNSTLKICVGSSPVFTNMPVFINVDNVDIGGIGGGGSAPGGTMFNFFYTAGFVILNQADRIHIHDLSTNFMTAPAIHATGANSSYLTLDRLHLRSAGWYENIRFGGNLITCSVTNFVLDGPSHDFGNNSVVISLQTGGTTNTCNFGDGTTSSETFNKGFKFMAPFKTLALGGCSIQFVSFNRVFYESSVDPGFVNADSGYSWDEGCSIEVLKIDQSGSYDPRVATSLLYGTFQAAAGTVLVTGVKSGGPLHAQAYYPNIPCVGAGVVVINSTFELGTGSWGCTGPVTNIIPTGIETSGRYQAVQPGTGQGSGPSHTTVAANPYMTSVTTQAGGSFAAGTYFYYVTGCTTPGLTNCTATALHTSGALDNYGELVVTTPLNNENLLTINHTYASSTTFDHLNIWRATVSGLPATATYQTYNCPCVWPVVFTDEGVAGTSGNRPLANTAYLFNVDISGNVHAPMLIAAESVEVTAIAVGSLPAAAGGNAGQWRTVNDSTAVAVAGQTCVGGGAVTAAAFSSGVVWKCF